MVLHCQKMENSSDNPTERPSAFFANYTKPQQIVLTCPLCGKHFVLINREMAITLYVRNIPIRCPSCHERLDLWSLLIEYINTDFFPHQVLRLVGSSESLFKISMKPNIPYEICFTDHGVPVDAEILYINLTPGTDKGVYTALMRNQYFPQKAPRRVGLLVCADADSASESEIHVAVSWIHPTPDASSWQALADAFESFHLGDYQGSIIPANVAVESMVRRLVSRVISQFSSRERVDSFLDNAATYSHQLNILLPVIAGLHKAEQLPTHIRGSLNRLRNIRNSVGHGRSATEKLDKKSMSQFLCAALFAFHYVMWLEAKYLDSDRSNSP